MRMTLTRASEVGNEGSMVTPQSFIGSDLADRSSGWYAFAKMSGNCVCHEDRHVNDGTLSRTEDTSTYPELFQSDPLSLSKRLCQSILRFFHLRWLRRLYCYRRFRSFSRGYCRLCCHCLWYWCRSGAYFGDGGDRVELGGGRGRFRHGG